MDDGSSEGWNLEWGNVLQQNVTDGRMGRHSEFIYKIVLKIMVDFLKMGSQWTFEMMKLHLSCKNYEKCELKKHVIWCQK